MVSSNLTRFEVSYFLWHLTSSRYALLISALLSDFGLIIMCTCCRFLLEKQEKLLICGIKNARRF